ncbi:hypothetical protein DMN91_010082 [Ooceraea biroi]|uniref:NDUFAF4-like protein n=1 Tax=Ooceraea biroi TaxID=2015173 RepID=A0A026W7W3_OOCBI|nr:protein NDUFAF4 homolog [Ooceraea biroi]XP_011342187.1 protein NDUFAF4 homolog [Ooceraea biroi]EZA52140.1 NDUFAF4-like protein [Ooceraea biroi]RLU17844.1 hypothetical protein DMN91_010082 [Ooceraea biroi]
MGKVYSALVRPLRTFNIENRAAKVISQQKPVTAPQYKYVEQQKEIANKVSPDFLEDHYRKDVQLDQRLKDVFVTSTDPQVTTKPSEDSKPLPRYTFNREEPTYNYYEPTVIPVGKCSAKQAIIFLAQHKQDPVKYSIENIAAEYKLDKEIVSNVLKYFHLFVAQRVEVHEEYEEQTLDDPLQREVDFSLKMKKEEDLAKKKKIAGEKK